MQIIIMTELKKIGLDQIREQLLQSTNVYNPINIISLLDNREMTDYIDALKLISFLIDYHNLMSYKN